MLMLWDHKPLLKALFLLVLWKWNFGGYDFEKIMFGIWGRTYFLIKWIQLILFLQISSTNLSATSYVQGIILGARDPEVNRLVSWPLNPFGENEDGGLIKQNF